MNTPPRKEEGSYTYSLRAGGILQLIMAVRHLEFLRSSCKNPPPHKLSQFMITLFASCFTMVKAEGWGTYPICKARPSYNLILGPLFWEYHPCCGSRFVLWESTNSGSLTMLWEPGQFSNIYIYIYIAGENWSGYQKRFKLAWFSNRAILIYTTTIDFHIGFSPPDYY